MPSSEPAPHSGIAALLGFEALGEEDGVYRARFEAKPEFLNPRGVIQGGMLTAMLDSIISHTVRLSLPDEQRPRATLEMKVSFISAAQPGPINGQARIVHRGRSVVFAEGRLETLEGELIATGSATMRVYTES